MIIEQLELMVKHLEADDFLDGATIVHQEHKSLLNEIKIGLASLGLLLVCRLDRGNSESSDAPGPLLDKARWVVDVTEVPKINRPKGNKTALQVAERVAWLFHWENHNEGSSDTKEAERAKRLEDLKTHFNSMSSRIGKTQLTWSVSFIGSAEIHFDS